MRVWLTAYALLISLTSFSQETIKIIGQVSVCELTKNNINLSKILDDGSRMKICDVTKNSKDKVIVNTLIANVIISKGDSIYHKIETDAKGKFIVKELPRDTFSFKIKIRKYLEQEYRVICESGNNTKRITFCLSDSLFTAKTDSIIYSKIPYNSDKALQNISNGDIYYLILFSGTPLLENSDNEYLEKKYGFKFLYDYPQFPTEYLLKAQEEYNAVVFEYLSMKCKCDFESEYQNDVIKLFREKLKSNEAD